MSYTQSSWNAKTFGILGNGMNVTPESIRLLAEELGWQDTWMTVEVTTFAKRKAQAKASPEQFVFFPPPPPTKTNQRG